MKGVSFKRGYQVVRVALQHGLDELLPQSLQPKLMRFLRPCLFWLRNQHPEKSGGERLTLALETLGPIHIKLGQMLSTRRDLLPQAWADELAKLQDQVPPFANELAMQSMIDALQAPLEDYFAEIEPTPLASASISQVYRARLKTNDTPVIIKVLRPNVEQQVAEDLQLLKDVAKWVRRWVDKGNRLRLSEVIADYEQTIVAELDLLQEAKNTQTLKANFERSPSLYIPKVYPELCRQRLLVAEYVDGIPVGNIEALIAQGTDLKKLAERGVEVFFTQVFRDNFFHADMHPGNILVSREHPNDPYYIGLDCGIMGQLTASDQRYLAEIFLAFFNRDYQRIATLYIDAGWINRKTDVDAFSQTVAKVCEPMFAKKLSEISFGQVLVELFDAAKQFDLVLQPQLVLLEKTLLYVEGLGRQLYPELDLWATAKPFLEQWMQEQIGPKAMLRKVKSNLPLWSDRLPEYPELIYQNLSLGKQLLSEYPQLFEQYLNHATKTHKSNYFLITSAVMVICGTIIFAEKGTLYLASACYGLGGILWLTGWRSRPKNKKF